MDALLRQALVGTRRSGVLAPTGTPADALSEHPDPAWRLLLRAGTLSLLRRAARPPQSLPAPNPAPEGDKPCPAALVPVFSALLNGETPELLPEALRLLASAGRALPPPLLPRALGLADPGQRALLAPVLGARGRWLAAMNPDWRWALQESEPDPAQLRLVWETGRSEERIEALAAIRRLNPSEGLSWLKSVWSSERAEARALLLVGLAGSLGDGDEPFLELCLDERSARVRERAAALLRRLPDSRLSQRMFSRLSRLISWREPGRGLLERLVSRGPRLRAEAPEACTPDLVRDGVSAVAEYGLTPPAWWLSQMLAAVPVSRWNAHFGVSPATMIAELPPDRWELAEGWSSALCNVPDGECMLALWGWWRRPDLMRGPARARAEHWQDELIRHLPHAESVHFALDILRSPSLPEAGRLSSALERLQPEWPAPVAAAWLDALRESVANLSGLTAQELLWWELSIHDAAPNLPRAALADAVFPIPETLAVRRWRSSLESFINAVQRRQFLIRELTP